MGGEGGVVWQDTQQYKRASVVAVAGGALPCHCMCQVSTLHCCTCKVSNFTVVRTVYPARCRGYFRLCILQCFCSGPLFGPPETREAIFEAMEEVTKVRTLCAAATMLRFVDGYAFGMVNVATCLGLPLLLHV